jgi:hypothetical protein
VVCRSISAWEQTGVVLPLFRSGRKFCCLARYKQYRCRPAGRDVFFPYGSASKRVGTASLAGWCLAAR